MNTQSQTFFFRSLNQFLSRLNFFFLCFYLDVRWRNFFILNKWIESFKKVCEVYGGKKEKKNSSLIETIYSFDAVFFSRKKKAQFMFLCVIFCVFFYDLKHFEAYTKRCHYNDLKVEFWWFCWLIIRSTDIYFFRTYIGMRNEHTE